MQDEQIRPRLPKHLEPFIDRLKDITPEEANLIFNGDKNLSSKTDIVENENGITIKYHGGKPIRSKQEAIDYFEIDTNLYEVVSFECKSWTTAMKLKREDSEGSTIEEPHQVVNYGINLRLKKKPSELNLANYKIKPKRVKKQKGKGNVVACLSDFHIGAYVGDLLKTKTFSFDVICGYLEAIAENINTDYFENVHVMLLGDFIESFTGLNHINSWKGLHKGSYGMGAVILAHEILCEHLYSKIHNIASVDFVSGNHDRITSNNSEDVNGEVGKMLHYLFNKEYDIDNTYSDILIKRKVDNIGFLGTHGHLGLSKKDTGKIVQDYGFNDADYHFVVQGHKHAREGKRHLKKSLAKYEDIDVVLHDSLDYRKVVVSPLFTGNFYSESLGYTSTAGFSKFWKNEFGQINHLDITL
ncbi:MAG: hypothetical protein ACWA5P_01940 [bacterium]